MDKRTPEEILADQLARREDRKTGFGMITPTPRDSAGNPIKAGPAPLPKPPSKGVGQMIKELGAKVLGQREHTPEEEATFKARGQQAFYNAEEARKIAARRTSLTGSVMSPTTRKDK